MIADPAGHDLCALLRPRGGLWSVALPVLSALLFRAAARLHRRRRDCDRNRFRRRLPRRWATRRQLLGRRRQLGRQQHHREPLGQYQQCPRQQLAAQLRISPHAAFAYSNSASSAALRQQRDPLPAVRTVSTFAAAAATRCCSPATLAIGPMRAAAICREQVPTGPISAAGALIDRRRAAAPTDRIMAAAPTGLILAAAERAGRRVTADSAIFNRVMSPMPSRNAVARA